MESKQLKLEDVINLEKKGDKCLKTGMLKWSKDLAGAASCYDDAVDKFILLSEYLKAISVLKKVKEVNNEMNDHWAMARNYEKILECMRRLKNSQLEEHAIVIKNSFLKYQLADSLSSFVRTVNTEVE